MNQDDGKLTGIQLAITSAALEGDATSIYHIVQDLLGQGMPFDAVLFDVLAPVQAAVGHRWQFGDYLISEEHAVTAAIETVISTLAGMFEPLDERPHVVIGAVEGDTHSLPARMIGAHLAYLGFHTTLLGATMPAEDLGEFLAGETPDVLVLTCAMSMHLPGAAASIAAAHSVGVPVVVGGNAFGPDGSWATRLGADLWVPGMADVAAALTKETPQLRPDSAFESPPGLAELTPSRPLFVTGAAAALAGEAGGVRHYDEVGLLFDFLVAAMVAGDESVLVDFTDWLATLLDARGASADTVRAMVAALQTVIEPTSPEAGRFLAAATSHLGA